MSARKRCGAPCLPVGSRCPWGVDRSPEVSSPEQEPEYNPVPCRIPWHRGFVPSTPPGRVPSDDVPVKYSSPVVRRSPLVYCAAVSEALSPGICLPNLEPGGPGYLPRKRSPPKRKDVAKESLANAKCDYLSLTTSPEP